MTWRLSSSRDLLRQILLLYVLMLGFAPPAFPQSSAAMGLDYWSDYFWRGFSFYGDAESPRGVFYPWVDYSWKELSLAAVGELPQSMLGGNPNSTEQAWAGVDFILSHSTSLFDDRVRLGSRVAYFLYPNSPNVNADGARNDFVDLGVWFQLDTLPLKPRLEYSHYLRIDDHNGQQITFEDIYLRLSLRQNFEPLEHLILTASGSIAYFWYPSSEYWNSPDVGGHGDDYRGLSDIVGSIRATTDLWPRFTPYASLNVAFVPDQDFYRIWGRDQHVHVWVTVGVSYRWPLGAP
jgi:hypothetical protein